MLTRLIVAPGASDAWPTLMIHECQCRGPVHQYSDMCERDTQSLCQTQD